MECSFILFLFCIPCKSQDKDEIKGEDGSMGESDESKAKKEDKDDKGKKKKVKRHKVKSDSPEHVGMAEDPGDTQVCKTFLNNDIY